MKKQFQILSSSRLLGALVIGAVTALAGVAHSAADEVSLAGLKDGRPRALCGPNDVQQIQKKISDEAWASSLLEGAKQRVARALELHQQDPELVLGRILMHRQEGARYTKTIAFAGEEAESEGGAMNRQNNILSFGDAPVPTPIVSIGQSRLFHEGKSVFPGYKELEDWPLHQGEDGMYSLKFGHKRGAVGEIAMELPADRLHEHPMRNYLYFMKLASDAAFIYWVTGDEEYAKLGTDIITFWCEGAQHLDLTYTLSTLLPTEELSWKKDLPLENELRAYKAALKPGDVTDLAFFKELQKAGEIRHNPRWCGLDTEHPINAKEMSSLPFAYDFLYSYMKENKIDTKPIELTLKKFADSCLDHGNGWGNINMMEGFMLVACALPLESNDRYEDGRGVEYYLDQFLNHSVIDADGYPSSLSLSSHLDYSHDKETGLLKETFGYTGHTNWYLRAVYMLENAGVPVIGKHPELLRATYSQGDFLFPHSNQGPAYGDAGSNGIAWKNLELGYAIANLVNDVAAVDKIGGFLKMQTGRKLDAELWRSTTAESVIYQISDLPKGETKAEQPVINELKFSGTVVQRNDYESKENAMMGVMYGAEVGHGHENGLSIEMFNKGHVFSTDALALGGLNYRSNFRMQFTVRYAAHNTVLVNSASSTMQGAAQPLFSDPEIGALTATSNNHSFAKMYFDEASTQSDQVRSLAIVKSSENLGFYVDVFRSKKRDGKDETHDYIYHNVGREFDFKDAQGASVSMQKSRVLKDAQEEVPVGYSLLNNQKTSGEFSDDFRVQFGYQIKEAEINRRYQKQPKESWGDSYVTNMWQLGAVQRELVRVDGEALWPDQPYRQFPHESMAVVRQHGEAWTRPFVSVFETYKKADGAGIKSVKAVAKTQGSLLVAVNVQMHDGNQHLVLDSQDIEKRYQQPSFTFKGVHGVISQRNGLTELYLGKGAELSQGDYAIRSHLGNLVSGTIQQQAQGEWSVKLSHPSQVQVPVPAGQKLQFVDLATKIDGLDRFPNDRFLSKEIPWKDSPEKLGFLQLAQGDFLLRIVEE